MNREKVKNILQLLRNKMDSSDIEAIILDYLKKTPDDDYNDNEENCGYDYDEIDRHYEEQYQEHY